MADITDTTPLSTAGHSPDGNIKWVRNASDVSRLVNDGSQGRANARIVVGIALGGIFLDAYDLGALAFGIKDITREFNLTPAGTGMVASAITFGAIVGALLGGYLTDKIGRYRVFMADMLFFVVAAIACALAPNEYALAGARFVMGWSSAWGSICRWRWRFLASSPGSKAPETRPPASQCGAQPGMPQSASLTCWCYSSTPYCQKVTATGCGA